MKRSLCLLVTGPIPRSAADSAIVPKMTIVEVPETTSLVLSESERRALLRLLYVVKDNFWLDDIEETLLERLLEPPRPVVANEWVIASSGS